MKKILSILFLGVICLFIVGSSLNTRQALGVTEENIVEIKKILEKVCPFVPEVVTSKLGADAPIIGGIKVALDYAEEQIIMLWKS